MRTSVSAPKVKESRTYDGAHVVITPDEDLWVVLTEDGSVLDEWPAGQWTSVTVTA